MDSALPALSDNGVDDYRLDAPVGCRDESVGQFAIEKIWVAHSIKWLN
ncbi:hypothetical protein [Shewanella gelidii]|nr:hypothetical protein [Shewanella gelidii]MCL1097213.1 hypothetical protein [Shewanella gelidii]